MKRLVSLLVSCLLLITMTTMTLTGCNTASDALRRPDRAPTEAADIRPTETTEAVDTAPAKTAENSNQDVPTITEAPSDKVINVFCPTDETTDMIMRYKELHPDFPYEIKPFIFATIDGDYHAILDTFLASDDLETPDIYCVDSAKVVKFSQGESAKYATPYKELGLDLDYLLKEADIPQYVIDMGTNPEGEIVALSYHGTGGAFIYRRSIAKDVWGTDDPEIIKHKIGPGWEKFFEAAAELKAKGYGIVSGDGDIWRSVENSAEKPWIVDGKLYIDPKREEFFDLAKELKDKGYSNDTQDWYDEWYLDMKGEGKQPIFGFFGASWMVNYVIMSNCGGKKIGEGTFGDWAVCEPPVGFFWGGNWVYVNKDSKHKEALGDIIKWLTLDTSETGLQYLWANGTLYGEDEGVMAVTSGTVMRKANGRLDFLGNQNMFEVYDKAARLVNGKNKTLYDDGITSFWREQVREYTAGNKSKMQAIADFKKKMKEVYDVEVE